MSGATERVVGAHQSVEPLVDISMRLSRKTERLKFGAPVAFVYTPLRYAWEPHVQYLRRYGRGPKEVLLVGMNPGPFGMAQTGIPFGEVAHVRDWMGIHSEVEVPPNTHPKRPIQGFACSRSEVSGARLWGWAKSRFGPAESFFSRFFVTNYCPLVFMEASGRNHTPDKLPKKEQSELFAACDEALRDTIAHLQPRYLIGVGAFARKRAEAALAKSGLKPVVGTLLHPSPASPKANRGWAAAAEAELGALGITLPK